MVDAAPAEFYDDILRDPDARALIPLNENPWLPVYTAAYALIPSDAAPIVDLGCGPGRFAELVARYHRGRYYGYDFSEVAIQSAIASIPNCSTDPSPPAHPCPRCGLNTFTFEQLDLRDWDPQTAPTDAVFVCLEVLEHLDDDIGLVAKIPPGATFVASVPNYDSAAHIRTFPTVGAIWQRYADLLDFHSWQLINTGLGAKAIHLLRTVRRNDSWG